MVQSNLRLVGCRRQEVHESGAFPFRTSFRRKPGLDPCRREIRHEKGYKFSTYGHFGGIRQAIPAPLLTKEAATIVCRLPLRNHLPIKKTTSRFSVKRVHGRNPTKEIG